MVHGIVSGTVVVDGPTREVDIHKLVSNDEWDMFSELSTALEEHFADAEDGYSFIALVIAESIISNTHDIPEYDVEYRVNEITDFNQLLR